MSESSRGIFRLLRRTVRLRLTLLVGCLLLLSGAALLGITYLLAASEFPTRFATHGTLGGLPDNGGFSTSSVPAHVMSQQAQQRAADLHQLLVQSGIALAIMAVVSVGLGWLVAGRILRPLRMMTTKTREIFEDNLHQRLDVEGPADELKELGDTIDGLLARLESAFDAQRRFVANASHELRTPLTLERSMLEVAIADPAATAESLRTTCEEVLVVSRQQETLIEALLTLARSQRGLDHRDPVDLAAVAGAVLRSRQQEMNRRGLQIRASLGPACVLGDARLIERLVTNLVDNAMHYNVPGGHVDVVTGTQSGRTVLSVVNTGPVVPADQVERLLQPFQRLTNGRRGDRNGLGLGLSIVVAIASAHGAELGATPAPGGGLDVRVDFRSRDHSLAAARR